MTDYIEREAFLLQCRRRYCEDCERRKGIKNGKKKTVYAIGDAPCRACWVDDIMGDIEDFPAADVRPIEISDMPPHRWHTVLEAAPPKAGDEGYTGYLVYANGVYEIADYVEEIDGFAYFHVDGEYEPGVTHFLPLPPAPEGEK